MADQQQLEILQQGTKAWNAWRRKNPKLKPDLSHVELATISLRAGNFRGTNFGGCDLSGEIDLGDSDFRGCSFELADMLDSYCIRSDLRDALFVHTRLAEMDFAHSDLRNAELTSCDAQSAGFRRADLRGAQLNFCDLTNANFEHADLRGADLTGSRLIGTRFSHANLTGARVHAVTPWEVVLDGTIQADLIITPRGAPRITVDDLELAQFMYLLLESRNLRRVIDTMTSRSVLVLGNFGKARAERRAILQDKLRQRGLVPLCIDITTAEECERLMRSATLLARMSRFIVADLTQAPHVLQILEAVVPEVAVPVLPLVSARVAPRARFAGADRYAWCLETTSYKDTKHLALLLRGKWFERAEAMLGELRARRSRSREPEAAGGTSSVVAGRRRARENRKPT